jgi:hypothetical protein
MGKNTPGLLGLGRPIAPNIIQANVVRVSTPALLQPPVQAHSVLGRVRTMGLWPVRVGPRGTIRTRDEVQHRRITPVVVLATGASKREKLAF